MSITDPRLDRSTLDPLGGRVGLDDLRRGGEDRQPQTAPLEAEALRLPDFAPAAPARDPGEELLSAPAWDGVAIGGRQLAGDAGLVSRLSALPLSDAADHAADAVLVGLR